ncbi:triose-phosphate isomerase family protein [Halomonas sp. IOP_31]|mgnify:CR=1 FL=1|uniref:triose-phosphate isomerase family protein n=1 Tax=Halomonas sp. IOP_31 TaxID=2876584 RepID=UPI001E53B6B6|nr:triose-phosphate isomerase family protein [Halomonas sp. IOP_31]MCD6008551.1 triose-phosphate isomerase [Halomonas sp. IOP_31]
MAKLPITLGISFKMYFGYTQTLAWCRQIAQRINQYPTVIDGRVSLFVLPSFPAIAPAIDIFTDTPIDVGGQNLYQSPYGAYTGEVSGAMLADMGCRYVEVGHAERRRLFGEDSDVVAAKTQVALAHGLIPVLCIGEADRGDPASAIDDCRAQIDSALSLASTEQRRQPLVVAYEPHWAIGASESAPLTHIAAVCQGLREQLHASPAASVIYGGSAGPGLLTRLAGQVDGLFLGRFAHDSVAFEAIVEEASMLAASR